MNLLNKIPGFQPVQTKNDTCHTLSSKVILGSEIHGLMASVSPCTFIETFEYHLCECLCLTVTMTSLQKSVLRGLQTTPLAVTVSDYKHLQSLDRCHVGHTGIARILLGKLWSRILGMAFLWEWMKSVLVQHTFASWCCQIFSSTDVVGAVGA